MIRFFPVLILIFTGFTHSTTSSAAQLIFADGSNIFRDAPFSGLPTLPGIGEGASLPTFDTALGTLNSATFNWFTTLTLSGDAINSNVIGASYEATATGSIELFGTDIPVGPLVLAGSCFSLGCSVLDAEIISTDDGLNLAGELDLTGEPGVLSNGPDLFDIDFPLSVGLGGLPPHEFDQGRIEAQWDITVTVTYDYNPVPLPASLSLFAPSLSLLMLLAYGKRKNANS